jgi:hypothetical protein
LLHLRETKFNFIFENFGAKVVVCSIIKLTMRPIYFTVVLAILISSLGLRAQSSFDFGQPERQDISKSVQLFPNPATDVVNVKLEHINVNNLTVTMHNIIGNEIRVETDILDEHTLRIRVKDLDAGYYLLALNDSQSKFKGIYKFSKR